MATAYEMAAGMAGTAEGQAALTDYLRTGGVNIDPTTRAWCADFVNATMNKAGQKGTDSGMARSFMQWGQAVAEPQQGDVAVFSRGSDPSKGHVGFFDSVNPDGTIKVLGGNQSDSVSYGDYPAERLLGYRRPSPSLSPAASDFVKNNPQPGGFGLPVEQAAGLAPPSTPPPLFGSMSPGDTSIDPNVARFAFGDDEPKWGDRLKAAGKAFDQAANEYPAPRISGGGGDARQTGNALADVMGGPTVADALLKKRAPFLFG